MILANSIVWGSIAGLVLVVIALGIAREHHEQHSKPWTRRS